MSIHYLIDPFTNAGDIIDVVTADSGETDSTGATVIRVPDGVAIHDNPTNLADLLTAKYDGLLASYAGFTQIVADSCMDALTVDPALSKEALISSGFVNHCLIGGALTSVAIPLLVAPPTQCVVTWEAYTFVDSNDKNGRYQRVYQEAAPNLLLTQVSFNNSSTFNNTTDGAVLNIPVPDQGATLIITFAAPSRVYLGSWAVIF